MFISTQPRFVAKELSLNRSSPLFNGLRMCVVDDVDLYTKARGVITGTVPFSYNRNGPVSGPVTSTANYFSLPSNLKSGESPQTVFVMSAGSAGYRNIVGKQNGNGRTLVVPPALQGAFQDTLYISGRRYGAGSLTNFYKSDINCSAIRNDANGSGWYVNGVRNTSSFYIGFYADWDPALPTVSFHSGFNDSAWFNDTEKLLIFCMWTRLLSDVELAAVTANPWILFSANPGQLWASISAGTNYNQSVFGSLSTTGSLLRQTNKRVVGNATTSGTVRKFTSTRRTGSVTTSSGVNKLTSKRYSGATTTTGNLATSTGLEQATSGSITASGVVARAATFVRSYASQITLSGGLVKSTRKVLRSTITLSGNAFKRMFVLLTSAITSVGALSTFKFTPTVGGVFQRGMRFMRRFIGRR